MPDIEVNFTILSFIVTNCNLQLKSTDTQIKITQNGVRNPCNKCQLIGIKENVIIWNYKLILFDCDLLRSTYGSQ